MEFGILKTNKCFSLKYLSLSFSISFGNKECNLGESSFSSQHTTKTPPPQKKTTKKKKPNMQACESFCSMSLHIVIMKL